MTHPSLLVIEKKEWDRLKKQASPQEEPIVKGNEYLKELIERSQKWLKTWPDTREGLVVKVAKDKKNQHAKGIKIIKTFTKRKKQDNTSEAIRKARQMIFSESCYGKRLLSALIESKTLEERDVQIKFQKEIKQKTQEHEELQSRKVSYVYLDKNEEENKRLIKLKNIEIAQINKNMCKMQQEKSIESKEREKQLELEDKRLIESIPDYEKLNKEKCKHLQQATKEYEAEQKDIIKRRAERTKHDEAIAEVWRRHQEKIQYKMQHTYKEIYKNKNELTDNYEFIRKCQENEKKRYDDFVEVGIKRHEKRRLKKEQQDIEKQKQKRFSLIQSKKIDINSEKAKRDCALNNCVCDKQSLFVKSCHKGLKDVNQLPQGKAEKERLPFLSTSNGLLDKLKKREKEPSPWNGTEASHEQFAQHAGDTLSQCRYKNKARKVVDDYRRLYCLDSTTLPVAHY